MKLIRDQTGGFRNRLTTNAIRDERLLWCKINAPGQKKMPFSRKCAARDTGKRYATIYISLRILDGLFGGTKS
jgi:hypothetical protein